MTLLLRTEPRIIFIIEQYLLKLQLKIRESLYLDVTVISFY